MTELEKKAYAYAIERQKDPNYPTYNWEIEISDAYEQGYKGAVDKTCEWLINHNDYICGSTNGIVKYDMKQLVEDFKKYMEE